MAKAAPKTTNAERLNGLLTKALPSQAEQIKTGEWGKQGAPYRFSTLEDGRQRLQIENRETGETIGVVGTTRDELLDALEARLK